MGVLADLKLDEASVPWWALSVLPYRPGSDQYRVRRLAQNGELRKLDGGGALTRLWAEVVGEARQLAEEGMEEWLSRDVEACRWGALESARAFVEFTGLLDDTLKQPMLKDFHVRTARLMRTSRYVELLLPFSHGKSWLSSILVPLMDFAEEPEFTQARIYFNKDYAKFWIRKLMHAVEHTEQLHRIFPWVSRPGRGNPVAQIWSTDGFCIAGKKAMDPSFESFGVGQATGRRFWRVGCDDWVVSDTAASVKVNARQWDYFHTGPMSMTKPIPWRSHHSTRAPSTFVVGTLFDKRDFNHQLMQEWRELGYSVVRQDIYTDRSKTEVIWPEERPLEWVEAQKVSMGDRSFMLRCRNIVVDDTEVRFPHKAVDVACRTDLDWGDTRGLPCLVSFDPASGKRTRYAKYPAAVLCAYDDRLDEIHVVKYERWNLAMPRQIDNLADWSRAYACPVAVEDASQQIAYAQWMNSQYPEVRIFSHTTDRWNKRDWAQGVESLIPYFEQERIFIHAGGAPGQWLRSIREELMDYPQGQYTDLLMALWINKFQWQLRQQINQTRFQRDVPTYAVRGGTTVINLRAIREQRSLGEQLRGRRPITPAERRAANESLRDTNPHRR